MQLSQAQLCLPCELHRSLSHCLWYPVVAPGQITFQVDSNPAVKIPSHIATTHRRPFWVS